MTDFPVPEGVRTSVTLHELKLLQKYAHIAGTALEIGTHLGFTCIGMALAGASVRSIDPHWEGPADDPDTWEPFSRNLQRHGFERIADVGDYRAFQRLRVGHEAGPSVLAHRQAVEDFEFQFLEAWGLVFIDGNHVWPCPMRDAEIAIAHLTEPGYLAFHDVTPNWPGVWRTVQELQAAGRITRLEQAGTLAVYQVRA